MTNSRRVGQNHKKLATRELARNKDAKRLHPGATSAGCSFQGHHMQKLKGSGSTFSTSGKHWKPFMLNPKVAKRNARLHRMIRNGIIEPMSKVDMRKAADAAIKRSDDFKFVDADAINQAVADAFKPMDGE